MKAFLKQLFWWIWPTTKAMKERQSAEPKKEELPPTRGYLTIYVNGQPIPITQLSGIDIDNHGAEVSYRNYGNLTFEELIQGLIPPKTLQQQLDEAIESENYEEAARIRDLIKKECPK